MSFMVLECFIELFQWFWPPSPPLLPDRVYYSDCYQMPDFEPGSNKWYKLQESDLIIPLQAVLFNEEYDKVRYMTGYTEPNHLELIFKIGQELGDPKFRREHDIDDMDAARNFGVCTLYFRMEDEHHFYDRLIENAEFDFQK